MICLGALLGNLTGVPGKRSAEIGKEELNKYIIAGYFLWAEGKHKSTY